MKKKFAFILMGNHYTPAEHKACFETENQITYICTVKSFEEVKGVIETLVKDGVGAVELCGAFGKERADEIIAYTDNKLAVGFVIHNPEQDELFKNFFGK